ncbi:MAG: hypothetical protein ABIJ27_03850 [Candidatus Omnitrophota bacterium]
MKRKGAAILFFAALFLSSAVFARAEEAFETLQSYASNGVIVPEEYGKNFFWGSGYKAEGFWTPAKKDIAKAERQLAAYLKEEAAERSPELWKQVSRYNRQYVGVIVFGRKNLWVNLFHKSVRRPSWRNEPVLVSGGGDRFFNVLYDVEEEKYFDLQINAAM